jgi:hypothetical protein
MATVTKKFLPQERSNAQPAGNTWSQIYSWSTNSSGVFVDSNQTTAVNVADVVRIGILPAGITLTDCLVVISDAFAASTTYTLGFAYTDGVDVTAVPQDVDYFIVTTTASSSQARTAMNNLTVRPVTLPKDAYLILTVEGANNSAVGVMDVIVRGIQTGV